MNEEILRIQKMVAEGKITPEEGTELVETVRAGTGTKAGTEAPAVPAGYWAAAVIGFVAFAASTVLLAGAAVVNLLARADNGTAVTIVPEPLPYGLLELLAITLGLIAWRVRLGKVAVVGGLVGAVALATWYLVLLASPCGGKP